MSLLVGHGYSWSVIRHSGSPSVCVELWVCGGVEAGETGEGLCGVSGFELDQYSLRVAVVGYNRVCLCQCCLGDGAQLVVNMQQAGVHLCA